MGKNRKKFLLDDNLGTLAKWLRILGYDAAVYRSISIQKKISLCNKERRIFLTRSKKLAKRKESFSRILIRSEKYDEQLLEMQDLIELKGDVLFSRCLKCNSRLHKIQKEKIAGLVPENVKCNFSDFKICRKCGKIYWNGSHYEAMKNKLNDLMTS